MVSKDVKRSLVTHQREEGKSQIIYMKETEMPEASGWSVMASCNGVGRLLSMNGTIIQASSPPST